MIRKKTGKEVYGLTMPLITKADGTKFGKSEGNAVWLDKEKTSSYELYQFFLNVEDSKVIEYLKKLTFLSLEEIELLEKSHEKEPHLREAHKVLAREVITFLHGREEYENAVKISEQLFSGNIQNLTKDQIMQGLNDVPSIVLKEEVSLLDLLVQEKIVSSKREGREFLENRAISVNGNIVTEEGYLLTRNSAIENEIFVIRKGKKKYYLVQFIEN